MSYTNYESTMERYSVNYDFVSQLATLMLEGNDLTTTWDMLSATHDMKHLSIKKLYVIASSIASSIMCEDMSVVAPRMFHERMMLNQNELKRIKSSTKSKHVVDEFSDLEEILDEIEEAFLEFECSMSMND